MCTTTIVYTFVVYTIIKMKLQDELKIKRFQDSKHRAMLNIVFTSYWMNDQFGSTIKPFNVSEEQYNVLRILLGQKGNAINLKDIQERMIHKTSNVTRLVEKLRLKRLVIREVCEGNRRKVEILITKEGENLLEQMTPVLKKGRERIFKNLTNNEADSLADLLDKLRG